MFSVILPTIWSPNIEQIDSLIHNLNKCYQVDEIILINNAPQIYIDRYKDLSKVKELQFQNIYVNPSWNAGVQHSKNENLCILNDDIFFNTDIFEFILHNLNRTDIKIIGMSKSCYSLKKDHTYTLEKVDVRNKGWGCIIFVKKSNYIMIPKDLRIYFGDDYLIKQMSGYVWKIEGLKIVSETATSVVSDANFEQIIREDTQNSRKYELPWSNDY